MTENVDQGVEIGEGKCPMDLSITTSFQGLPQKFRIGFLAYPSLWSLFADPPSQKVELRYRDHSSRVTHRQCPNHSENKGQGHSLWEITVLAYIFPFHPSAQQWEIVQATPTAKNAMKFINSALIMDSVQGNETFIWSSANKS